MFLSVFGPSTRRYGVPEESGTWNLESGIVRLLGIIAQFEIHASQFKMLASFVCFLLQQTTRGALTILLARARSVFPQRPRPFVCCTATALSRLWPTDRIDPSSAGSRGRRIALRTKWFRVPLRALAPVRQGRPCVGVYRETGSGWPFVIVGRKGAHVQALGDGSSHQERSHLRHVTLRLVLVGVVPRAVQVEELGVRELSGTSGPRTTRGSRSVRC